MANRNSSTIVEEATFEVYMPAEVADIPLPKGLSWMNHDEYELHQLGTIENTRKGPDMRSTKRMYDRRSNTPSGKKTRLRFTTVKATVDGVYYGNINVRI